MQPLAGESLQGKGSTSANSLFSSLKTRRKKKKESKHFELVASTVSEVTCLEKTQASPTPWAPVTMTYFGRRPFTDVIS